MKIYEGINNELATIIRTGGVGVLATDTIYGLVASALIPKSVERVYAMRQRNLTKPLIILISSWNDLEKFHVSLDEDDKKKISLFWPGKVSVILPCLDEEIEYLHRGKKSLAFRWPKNRQLEELIRETGPLVAPSANPEGFVPAKTIKEAQAYFGEKADFYVDSGKIVSAPSAIVRLDGGKTIVVRSGEGILPPSIDKR